VFISYLFFHFLLVPLKKTNNKYKKLFENKQKSVNLSRTKKVLRIKKNYCFIMNIMQIKNLLGTNTKFKYY